jgi:hypothetical protein
VNCKIIDLTICMPHGFYFSSEDQVLNLRCFRFLYVARYNKRPAALDVRYRAPSTLARRPHATYCRVRTRRLGSTARYVLRTQLQGLALGTFSLPVLLRLPVGDGFLMILIPPCVLFATQSPLLHGGRCQHIKVVVTHKKLEPSDDPTSLN